jgi:hypothetical protein
MSGYPSIEEQTLGNQVGMKQVTLSMLADELSKLRFDTNTKPSSGLIWRDPRRVRISQIEIEIVRLRQEYYTLLERYEEIKKRHGRGRY